MPLYEFECPQCKTRREVLYRSHDELRYRHQWCAMCADFMAHVQSAATAHFKGSGFYETDYKEKK